MQGTLQRDVKVCVDAVLRYFWRGFAEILIVGCGIAVFQDQVVFVFYQLGEFRCAICGILLFFGAVFPFSEPLLTPHYIMADNKAFLDVLNEKEYETREHCNEDTHLLIQEPTERSQKV